MSVLKKNGAFSVNRIDKFLSGRPTFWGAQVKLARPIGDAKKMGTQNQIARSRHN